MAGEARLMRVCIVSPFAYGALTGGHRGHAGGVEQQTTLFARWLAARGHDVSLVTWDEGQPDGEVIDGVRVLTMCRRDAGLKGLRFLHPRWSSLHAAMRRADAEVYYQNCGDYVTGQVAAFCRRHGRGFVYSVASDPDCDPRLPKLPALRERLLYRYGIRNANRVVVQTPRQREMLASGFGLDSVVLHMPLSLRTDQPASEPWEPETPRRVVWVGRISARVKRFDVLLDIAQRMPDVRFEVAGQVDVDDDHSRALMMRARGIANVVLKGLVPREQMPAVYRGATALLLTSDYEGFPNTYLEAWDTGLPVVTTIDPGGLLADGRLGATTTGADGLAAALRALADDPVRWRTCSTCARAYVASHHAPDAALPPFERVLLEAMPPGRAPHAPVDLPSGFRP